MTATTVTRTEYIAAAKEVTRLTKIVRLYTQPHDPAFEAFTLDRLGPDGYATHKQECAEYLAATRIALAEAERVVDAWLRKACGRCGGSGDYNAPTSHYRAGRPVCFTCKGSGQRA